MNEGAGAAPASAAAAAGGLHTYRRLLRYLKPQRGAFALAMLGAILYAAAQSGFVYLGKLFGDGTFAARDPRTILWVPGALVGIFVVRGVGDFMQTYFMGHVGRNVVARCRREVFEHVMRLPVGWFDRNSSGTLLSRLTFNTEQIAQATTDSLVILVRASLTIVTLIAWLLYINVRLAGVALTMGPLAAWLVTLLNRRFRRYGRRIQDSMGDVTRVAKESFEAPRLVKVYNAEAHLDRQFAAANTHNLRSNMRLTLTKALSNPVVQLVTASGAAFVLSTAIADAVRGRMSMGDLVAFFVALTGIAQPLRELVGVGGPLQQGIVAGQNLFELLDEPGEQRGSGARSARVRGEVRFEHVSFAYRGGQRAALHDVSLEVAAGDNVAIVGRSGSGKSTLVSLLPRFYEPTAGAVRIDGRDVREYELGNLREQIALVSQEIVLFNDTIRNNIAFGREVPDAVLERAVEAAHVAEFVSALPSGLDTLVGDRGVLLSGGQRQRIAIARALLKDAPILILDEATSALDTEAERHIQAALAQLMRDRTTLVIAHRLSTVEQAGRIVVLEAGSVAESGTHAELLARGGLYAQLHRLQFAD